MLDCYQLHELFNSCVLMSSTRLTSVLLVQFAISLVLNVAKNLTSRGRDRDDFD